MIDSDQTTKHYDLRSHGDLEIAIVADTHGQVDPRVLQLISQSDVALHAGDILGAAVLESMSPRLGTVIAVCGNNDYAMTWPKEEHEILNQIPEVAVIDCVGGAIVIEHGHLLRNIETNHYPLAYKYPDARMVIYGHTHVQRLDQDSPPWLVNPGAAGLTRTNGGASCYQLRIQGEHWSIEEYRFAQIKRAS